MSARLDSLLYQNTSFHGQINPENLIFNDRLQAFNHKVGFICSLETAGKLTPQESLLQIQVLWQDLQQVGNQVGICV
jgi:hypothetical protein